MYEYKARVIDIHDGDTIRAEIDLGCDLRERMTLRLAGINAPELSTPEGKIALDWLRAALGTGDLVIRTVKDHREKYGRYLAYLWLTSEGTFGPNLFTPSLPSINERMVAAGQAVVYLP